MLQHCGDDQFDQAMMKKLGHSVKSTSKDDVKAKKGKEQEAGQVEDESQLKVTPDSFRNKYSLFAREEVQPCLKLTSPASHFEQDRTIDKERVATPEEELQTKQRSPLTILSEDEGYLLEDE